MKEGKLVESPMAQVQRLRVDNRRIRVLRPAEQLAVLRACQSNFKLAVLAERLLITGAREGEFLVQQWQDDHGSELTRDAAAVHAPGERAKAVRAGDVRPRAPRRGPR